MTVRFYPKGLLITFVFLAVFGATLLLALDARQGLAAAGILSLLAYLVVEVGVMINPAMWWSRRDR